MTADRLARLEDLTRRYARYRPCGAGLGVLWAGALLVMLTALFLWWTLSAYAAASASSVSLWRFLRSSPLVPPAWLVLAAAATPFAAWLGLTGIQDWVDGHFGAVESGERGVSCAGRIRGPHWMPSVLVGIMAVVLSGLLLVDATRGGNAVGIVGILAIAGWAIVWGRGSRDQLTQMVMLTLSIPPLYVIASTDAASKLAAGNLVIFGSYLVLMFWLLVQGATRFSGFLKVRRDLASIGPVEE